MNGMNGVVGRFRGRSFIVAQKLPHADQLLSNAKDENENKMPNVQDKTIST